MQRRRQFCRRVALPEFLGRLAGEGKDHRGPDYACEACIVSSDRPLRHAGSPSEESQATRGPARWFGVQRMPCSRLVVTGNRLKAGLPTKTRTRFCGSGPPHQIAPPRSPLPPARSAEEQRRSGHKGRPDTQRAPPGIRVVPQLPPAWVVSALASAGALDPALTAIGPRFVSAAASRGQKYLSFDGSFRKAPSSPASAAGPPPSR